VPIPGTHDYESRGWRARYLCTERKGSKFDIYNPEGQLVAKKGALPPWIVRK
jgi:hypothetical protein